RSRRVARPLGRTAASRRPDGLLLRRPLPPPLRGRPPRLGVAGPRSGRLASLAPALARRRGRRGGHLHLFARPPPGLGSDRPDVAGATAVVPRPAVVVAPAVVPVVDPTVGVAPAPVVDEVPATGVGVAAAPVVSVVDVGTAAGVAAAEAPVAPAPPVTDVVAP